MNPQISVIMLTYNRENYIRRAIDSILNQTFPYFEFIIVDNGSTDGSGDIADAYSEKDSRIHVIHKMRGNIGSGRNAGLDEAHGKYVAFIDDDDYAEKDFLLFLFHLAERYKADIAVCGSNQEQDGVISPNWILVYDECYVMDAEKAIEMFLRRKLYNAALPTKLINRNLASKIRFSETDNYDDIAITYKYLAHAKTIAAHGLPKYTFARHSGNNSSAATKHHLLNPEQLYEYIRTYHERTEYISEMFPKLHSLARYREFAYMLSMIEKIDRYHLKNCDAPLNYMRTEIRKNLHVFLEGAYCEEFEKKWLEKYFGVRSCKGQNPLN